MPKSSPALVKLVPPRSQMAEEQRYVDFARTGPGAPAGRLLRTFWHPVLRSLDLASGTAKPIRLLGEDFTLYRGESGNPYLVGKRCAHRGAQLSIGSVVGDDIRCFYHGWTYDGTGQCIQQPAERNRFCDKVRISAYPVRDYLGLVFAYIGSGEAPQLPRYSNFECNVERHLLDVEYRHVNFFQDFENNIDRIHGGFVHGSLPNAWDGLADSPAVEAEEDGWGIRTRTRHPSGRAGVQSFGMPCILHIAAAFEACERLVWIVPIDDELTVHFNLASHPNVEAVQKYREQHTAVPIAPSGLNRLARSIVEGQVRLADIEAGVPMPQRLWLQDIVALMSQGVIADRSNEMLGSSDLPIALMRSIWTREMRALVEGRPLKSWIYNPDVSLRRR